MGDSGHGCKVYEGGKLVVTPKGDIIPCEAFKGIVAANVRCEFILGNTRRGNTLEQAMERVGKIPYFEFFRREVEASEAMEGHLGSCPVCEGGIPLCEEGVSLAERWVEAFLAFEVERVEVRKRYDVPTAAEMVECSCRGECEGGDG